MDTGGYWWILVDTVGWSLDQQAGHILQQAVSYLSLCALRTMPHNDQCHAGGRQRGCRDLLGGHRGVDLDANANPRCCLQRIQQVQHHRGYFTICPNGRRMPEHPNQSLCAWVNNDPGAILVQTKRSCVVSGSSNQSTKLTGWLAQIS